MSTAVYSEESHRLAEGLARLCSKCRVFSSKPLAQFTQAYAKKRISVRRKQGGLTVYSCEGVIFTSQACCIASPRLGTAGWEWNNIVDQAHLEGRCYLREVFQKETQICTALTQCGGKIVSEFPNNFKGSKNLGDDLKIYQWRKFDGEKWFNK